MATCNRNCLIGQYTLVSSYSVYEYTVELSITDALRTTYCVLIKEVSSFHFRDSSVQVSTLYVVRIKNIVLIKEVSLLQVSIIERFQSICTHLCMNNSVMTHSVPPVFVLSMHPLREEQTMYSKAKWIWEYTLGNKPTYYALGYFSKMS